MTVLQWLAALFFGGIIVLVFIYLAVKLAANAWFRTQAVWIKRQKEIFLHPRKEE